MKKFLLFIFFSSILFLVFGCEEKEVLPTEDDKIHLIVLAGQSGARGKALVNDLTPDQKDGNVDVDIIADGLPMGDLANIPDTPDLDSYIDILEPGYGDFPSEFGPELGIGETMASRYPKFDEDYKSVIVKYTGSGSTFTDHWYSTGAINDDDINSLLNLDQVKEMKDGKETGPLTNNLYQLVDHTIKQLNDFGYEVVIDGLAFVHGEQDAKFDDNMAIYKKALSHFINDFRTYFNDKDMPVVITEALTNSAKYSNELRKIQNDVANSMENVSLVKTTDLYTNTFEPWHFGANSNYILGNRIAAEIISYNDTRIIDEIIEPTIDVPYKQRINLPDFVMAKFENLYNGYVKVEEYTSNYDPDKLGLQDVKFKVKTGKGTIEKTLKVNVSDKVAYIDGILNEYNDVKVNNLPNDLGKLYVIKGQDGLYIAADIKDNEIYTSGENWNTGDYGQHGNNDDFIMYLTTTDADKRYTLCLSSANLLRVYDEGISLNDSSIVLELNNLYHYKKIINFKYHVTTKSFVNDKKEDSIGLSLELFIGYDDLGITNPDQIKLCFNYNDIKYENNTPISLDNYFVKTGTGNNLEEVNDSYFSINDLI